MSVNVNALDPTKHSNNLLIAKSLCHIRHGTPNEIWGIMGKEGEPEEEFVTLLQNAKNADFELFDTCIVDQGMVDRVNESTEKLSQYLEKLLS